MGIERHTGTLVNCVINGTPISFFVANAADIIQRCHISGRFYEREELAVISRHFSPGDVFLDVGANVGNHALYVARFLSPGSILVIEPNPAAIVILRANIMLNDLSGIIDISHLGIGLARARGWAALTSQVDNLGGTRLTLTEDAPAAVPVAAGDTLLAGRKVDFIKIDVEGMELSVLDGLQATIARHRPRLFAEVEDRQRAAFDRWAVASGYTVVDAFRRYKWSENLMAVPNP
jgi:FkbM family methyltransferase